MSCYPCRAAGKDAPHRAEEYHTEVERVTGSLRLANDLAELSRLSDWVRELASELDLPPGKVFHLDMALEEIVTNVMKYAYGEDVDKPIEVSYELKNDRLMITVADYGPEFNPLQAEAPDTEKALEEMTIGGLGIALTLKMMDRVDYRRHDSKNLLTMVQNLAAVETDQP